MKQLLLFFLLFLSISSCQETNSKSEKKIETLDTPMAEMEKEIPVSSLDSQSLITSVKLLLESFKTKNQTNTKIISFDTIYCPLCLAIESPNYSIGGDTDNPIPMDLFLNKYLDSFPNLNHLLDSIDNFHPMVTSVIRNRSESNIIGNHQVVYDVRLTAKSGIWHNYDFIKRGNKFKLIGIFLQSTKVY